MFEDEIHIRIAEEGMAFVYSIVRAGVRIESAVVRPLAEEVEESVAPGYYGGSQTMD